MAKIQLLFDSIRIKNISKPWVIYIVLHRCHSAPQCPIVAIDPIATFIFCMTLHSATQYYGSLALVSTHTPHSIPQHYSVLCSLSIVMIVITDNLQQCYIDTIVLYSGHRCHSNVYLLCDATQFYHSLPQSTAVYCSFQALQDCYTAICSSAKHIQQQYSTLANTQSSIHSKLKQNTASCIYVNDNYTQIIMPNLAWPWSRRA